MLEKPEYYFKLEIEGTKWIRAYSEYPLPGFIKMERKTVSPWYATVDITNSIAVSGCWLTWNGDEIARDSDGFVILKANAAQFRGGSGAGDAAKDGTYNSMLGMPRTSISKAGVRPFCKNGTHHGAYRVYNEIAWLQRVEYASLHCQDTYTETLTADGFHQGGLGSGCAVNGTEWNTWGGYKPFVPCGVTATLGNNTGKVSYTIKGWTGGDKVVQVTSYRGLETPLNICGCLLMMCWFGIRLMFLLPMYVKTRPNSPLIQTVQLPCLPDMKLLRSSQELTDMYFLWLIPLRAIPLPKR